MTTAAVNSVSRRTSSSLGFVAAVAIRFVEQAQAFHEEALGIQLGAGLGSFAIKVELEAAARPVKYLEHRWIAFQWAVGGVHDLALVEIDVALVVLPGQGQQAAFAAHFEGLHQIDHVHLRKAAAQHAVRRRRLGHLFQCNFVDTRLMRRVASFRKNGFSTKSSTGSCCERRSLMSVLVARMIAAKLAVAGRLRSFSMSPAVHARHAIVGNEQVRRIVHRLEEGIGGVAGGSNLAKVESDCFNIPSTMGLSSTSNTLTLLDMLFKASWAGGRSLRFCRRICVPEQFADFDALVESLAHVVYGQGRDRPPPALPFPRRLQPWS